LVHGTALPLSPCNDPCVVARGGHGTESPLVPALIDWFDAHERALPWRSSDPWGVLTSEFMLQQTPVDRVIPVWHAWRERWPTPEALAVSSVGDALRAWGRLGYPRRAARLHASAVIITRDHDGTVPHETEALRALPGVGDYTAAAVQAFAFGRRSVVLDTNVRRVLARTLDGTAAQTPHITTAERTRSDDLWPAEDARSARWSAAVMEFGAVVCTARAPACERCPVQEHCLWTHDGRPQPTEPGRRQPTYAGSDREARGAVLQALRDSLGPLSSRAVASVWADQEQRERALEGLVSDGLVVRLPRGRYALPS